MSNYHLLIRSMRAISIASARILRALLYMANSDVRDAGMTTGVVI